jgi:hypothetical protein
VKISAVLHPEEASVVWAAIERVAVERCRASNPVVADPSIGSAEPTTTNEPAEMATATKKQRFDRADALVSIAQEILRGSSPDRAPIDLVMSVSIEALRTRPAAAAGGATTLGNVPPSATAAGADRGPSSFTDGSANEPGSGASVSTDDAAHEPAIACRGASSSTDDAAHEPAMACRGASSSTDDAAHEPAMACGGASSATGNSGSTTTVGNDRCTPPSPILDAPTTVDGTAMLRHVGKLPFDLEHRGWIYPTEDDSSFDPSHVGVLGDGACVSATTARRLACDCGLTPVLEDAHGTAITIGRKRRTIPASMKRALLRRDQTCRFPGCTTRVFLEGHHREHWVDGGETKLGNLVSLCGHHHRYVHEYGYRIELACDGQIQFVDPRKRILQDVPTRVERVDLGWPSLFESNAALEITAATCACGWNGGPVDYHLCIDALIAADEGRLRGPI